MESEALTIFGVVVPWDARTLDGFRRWAATLGERGPRVSFARGRMHVEMTPQNYDTHEPLVAAINTALRGLAHELDLGRYFLPPSWFTHEAAALSTEPDGFFATWRTLQEGLLIVNPARRTEMLGRPDMVLEVVSDTSARKDLLEHVEDYAAAGICEYWLADARSPELVFRILTLAPDRTYVAQPMDTDGWVASPLWGRRFRIRRFIDRVGLSDFALDVAG